MQRLKRLPLSAFSVLAAGVRRQPVVLATASIAVLLAVHWRTATTSLGAQAADSFKHLQPATVVAALMLSSTAALLSGMAWQRLITQLGYRCSLHTGLTTYLSAGLGGYVLNGIGPAVGCAASLQSRGVPVRRSALITIIANVLGLLGVLIWTPLGLVVLLRSSRSRTLLPLGPMQIAAEALALLLLAIALVFVLYALARATRTHSRVAHFIVGPIPLTDRRNGEDVRCRRLLTLLPFNAASWIVGSCALYLILVAMCSGATPNVLTVIGCAAAASALGSLACFAPEGIGVSDSALVILLVHTTAVSPAICISAALAVRTLDPLTKLSLLALLALTSNPRRVQAFAKAADRIIHLGWQFGPGRNRVPAPALATTLPIATQAVSRMLRSFVEPRLRHPHHGADRRAEAAALFLELDELDDHLLAS